MPKAYGFSGPSGSACDDIVPLAAVASAVGSGPAYCGRSAMLMVSPSPGGTWLLVIAQSDTAFVRTADLAPGRWAPVDFDGGRASDTLFWDSPTSIVAGSDHGCERCSVTGACRDLHLARTMWPSLRSALAPESGVGRLRRNPRNPYEPTTSPAGHRSPTYARGTMGWQPRVTRHGRAHMRVRRACV